MTLGKGMATIIMKNKTGVGKKKLGLWSVLASALVLGASVLSSGASTPIKNAQAYACTNSCYFNYRTCLMAGNGQSFCATRYQNCVLQCTVSGAGEPESTTY